MITDLDLQEGLPDDETPTWALGLDTPTAERVARRRTSRNDSTTGRVRKAYASRGDDATLSRWVKQGPPLVEQLTLVSGPRQIDPKLARRRIARNRFGRLTKRSIR